MRVRDVIDIDGYPHLDTDHGMLRVNNQQHPGQLLRDTIAQVARIHLTARDNPTPTIEDWYKLAHDYYRYKHVEIYTSDKDVIIYGSQYPITETPRLPRGVTHARS